MNNDRRKKLEAVKGHIASVTEDLEAIRDEEQEYFDNMPENMQNGEKGETAETNVGLIEDALNPLQESLNAIEDLCNNL